MIVKLKLTLFRLETHYVTIEVDKLKEIPQEIDGYRWVGFEILSITK